MELKKFYFDKSKFKLGMRTFKSGLAVFLTLLLFQFFGWGGVQISALTAVFILRKDFDTSIDFGVSRILGNTIGGLFALLFFIVNGVFQENFLVTLVLVPICTMLTIMTNVSMNNHAGIIGGVSALLMISLSVPSGDTIFYVFERIFETFVGVFLAILVNYDANRVKKFLNKKSNDE